MKAIYFEGDDILQIRVSNKLTAHDASKDWNTHISATGGGSIVKIVLLDAKRVGFLPLN